MPKKSTAPKAPRKSPDQKLAILQAKIKRIEIQKQILALKEQAKGLK